MNSTKYFNSIQFIQHPNLLPPPPSPHPPTHHLPHPLITSPTHPLTTSPAHSQPPPPPTLLLSRYLQVQGDIWWLTRRRYHTHSKWLDLLNQYFLPSLLWGMHESQRTFYIVWSCAQNTNVHKLNSLLDVNTGN